MLKQNIFLDAENRQKGNTKVEDKLPTRRVPSIVVFTGDTLHLVLWRLLANLQLSWHGFCPIITYQCRKTGWWLRLLTAILVFTRVTWRCWPISTWCSKSNMCWKIQSHKNLKNTRIVSDRIDRRVFMFSRSISVSFLRPQLSTQLVMDFPPVPSHAEPNKCHFRTVQILQVDENCIC